MLLKSVFCGCDNFRSCYSPTRGLVSCQDPAPSFRASLAWATRRPHPLNPACTFFWKSVAQLGSGIYNLEVRSSTIWKCARPQWASVKLTLILQLRCFRASETPQCLTMCDDQGSDVISSSLFIARSLSDDKHLDSKQSLRIQLSHQSSQNILWKW